MKPETISQIEDPDRHKDGCSLWEERIMLDFYGELPEDQIEATRAHVNGCPHCRTAANDLRKTLGLVKAGHLRYETPPGFWTAYQARLEERLARSGRRTLWSRAAPLAAAASLCIATLVLYRSDLVKTFSWTQLGKGPAAEIQELHVAEDLDLLEELEFLEEMDLAERLYDIGQGPGNRNHHESS